MLRFRLIKSVNLGLLSLCLGSQASASLAFAQDSEPAAPQAEPASPAPAPVTKPKTSERIEVTGTRIKRVDAEGTTPVTTIDARAIEKSAAKNVGELLGKTSAAPSGNFAGTGLSVRSGASTVDLLGLGADRTLVLIDGRRLPVESSLGAANIANIPISVIERIDVLRGGASAIYGADAVGGVVNIITKKNVEGVEATVQLSVPERGGGESLELGALAGADLGEATRGLLFFGYKKSNETLRNNRDIKVSREGREYTAANPPQGEFSYRTLTDNNGVYSNPGFYAPSPNCPEANRVATVPSAPNDVYCAGLRKDIPSWLTPESSEFFMVGRAEHELTADSTLTFVGMFDQKKSMINLGNYLLGLSDPIPPGGGILLSPQRAADFGITGIPANQVVEIVTTATDMPDRKSENSDSVLGGTLALDSAWNEYDVRTAFAYFVTRNQRDFRNILNKQNQINLFHNRTNPRDPAYIPMDPNRNNALLSGIYDDLHSEEETISSDFDVSASRALMDLPGGKVQGLLGLNVSTLSYKQTPDAKDREFYKETLGQPIAADESNVVAIEPLYEGTSAVSGEGDRTVVSLYSEFVVPVTKSAEIDAALRYDNYSDFGNTTNYSLGAKYKVIESVLLRANAASSYKAPQLSMLHAEGGGGYVDIVDERWCARERQRGNVCEEGTGHSIYIDYPGNPDLKEEKGHSYSLGVVLEPYTGLSVSGDYHSIRLTGTHNVDQNQDVLDRFYRGESIGDNEVIADADGIVSSLRQPYQNLGEMEVDAVEARLNYGTNLGGTGLNYEANYFRYLSFKVRDFKSDPIRQTKGYKGRPAWRLGNSVGVNIAKQHRVSLYANTIAKQQTDPVDIRPGQNYHDVAQYTEYDLSYGTDLPWNGEVLVGINNVLDTQGGTDDSGNPVGNEDVDTSLYSISGRTFFAKLTQRF